jgi:DNA-binding beta-propeller fold protein YncE
VWPRAPAPPRIALSYVVASQTTGQASGSWLGRAGAWIAGTEAEATTSTGFRRPFDVAALARGGFVVADPDAGRLLSFDSEGDFTGDLTCPAAPWSAPMSVTEPSPGALLVVDGGSNALVRWTSKGCTTLPAHLNRPTGVAATADEILVADPGANQVAVLSRGGDELARWSGDGAADTFGLPSDVAAGPDGTAWVVDALNSRVVHVARDGRWLGILGQPPTAEGGLVRPKGIHVDGSGLIFVTDAERDQLLVYGRDGTLQFIVGAPGDDPGSFAHPAGVGGAGNRILVANSLNRRIQVFELIGALK